MSEYKRYGRPAALRRRPSFQARPFGLVAGPPLGPSAGVGRQCALAHLPVRPGAGQKDIAQLSIIAFANSNDLSCFSSAISGAAVHVGVGGEDESRLSRKGKALQYRFPCSAAPPECAAVSATAGAARGSKGRLLQSAPWSGFGGEAPDPVAGRRPRGKE
jgi:hypothetical protein